MVFASRIKPRGQRCVRELRASRNGCDLRRTRPADDGINNVEELTWRPKAGASAHRYAEPFVGSHVHGGRIDPRVDETGKTEFKAY
jgi:hypothetical protein